MADVSDERWMKALDGLNSAEAARAFDRLAEHGWAVSDGLVPEDFWRSVLHHLEARLEHFQPAAIGRGTERGEHAEIRGDRTQWLDPEDETTREVSLWLEGWRRRLNQEFSLGLRRFEAHFAAYPAGAGYDLHVDQHRGQTHRRLTFILYLNEGWGSADGGELELHVPGDAPRIIAPVGGRLVLFRSELFPHRVRPSQRLRKSLTGWFRDDSE